MGKNESDYFMEPWTTRCVLHASEESIVTSKALGRRPTVCTAVACCPASLLASSSPMLYTKPALKRVPRT